MSDPEDGMGEINLPCSPSPWGKLSNKWYFLASDKKCVRECEIGEYCNGQAMEGALYESFQECCQEHLADTPNSPCKKCSENYWARYFVSNPLPDIGYQPICEYQTTLLSLAPSTLCLQFVFLLFTLFPSLCINS